MVWISLFLLSLSASAQNLPLFLTKHASDTLRYITMDGRYAYVQKKPGVLGFVSSYRSVDFLSDTAQSDYLVKGSRFEERLVIEVIPNVHTEYNLFKNHRIHVVDWGNSVPREVGTGRAAKLHLGDEWVSFFETKEKLIHIQNLVTQKKHTIKLSGKAHPFFVPEVEMINQGTVAYTDVNDTGHSALISFDLLGGKSTVVYKSPQTGTKLELCQHQDYLAIGEFPHDGVTRSSRILQVKYASGAANLAGHSTIYESRTQDLGNMVCLPETIYFIQTTHQEARTNSKTTQAVKLDLKTNGLTQVSNLQTVTQLIEMNGRVLIPLRGDFYVVEGKNNIGVDVLKSLPANSKEELPLDI